MIRRSDRLRVGLSTDLIIEQVLMISMKTSGGQELNPFSNDPSMRNIATGVHAHPIISVDTARSVGAAILKSMEGKTSDEHSFIRKDQVVTLGTKSPIKIDGVEAQVDP